MSAGQPPAYTLLPCRCARMGLDHSYCESICVAPVEACHRPQAVAGQTPARPCHPPTSHICVLDVGVEEGLIVEGRQAQHTELAVCEAGWREGSGDKDAHASPC